MFYVRLLSHFQALTKGSIKQLIEAAFVPTEQYNVNNILT